VAKKKKSLPYITNLQTVYTISSRPNMISNNKIRIFMNVTLYTSADRYQCFRETSFLHLQGRKDKQGKRVYDIG
jgi:hypothetical protein